MGHGFSNKMMVGGSLYIRKQTTDAPTNKLSLVAAAMPSINFYNVNNKSTATTDKKEVFPHYCCYVHLSL